MIYLGYTLYNTQISKTPTFKTGVPQGIIISPIRFNIYLSGLTNYTNEITITATQPNYRIDEATIQLFLDSIANWSTKNNPIINTIKTQCKLFAPDPAE